MSFSVSRKRSFSVFCAWRDRALRAGDLLVVRFLVGLAMDPPLEANGKAALSSILARSKLGEAKGSDFASGLPWTIVSRALSTALGLVPVVWIGDGLPPVP